MIEPAKAISTAEVSNVRVFDSILIRALFSLELRSGTSIHCCALYWSRDRHCWTVVPPQIPYMLAHSNLDVNGDDIEFAHSLI